MRTIAVAGAGAGGMMAALTAAGDRQNRVVLLERQARAGRKLNATGNGRCNLTNMTASPRNYHGEDADFVRFALDGFPPEAVVEYFKTLGLLTVTEYGGRVYPLSNSANSVTDVLRFALSAAGVELRAPWGVLEIARRGGGFLLRAEGGELCADAVIVACGGMAGEKLGGVKDGYELLGSLGHSRTALRPSLVQITTDNAYPRALKGIRADCALSLRRGKDVLSESAGELQFTDTGVSGPAAFDLSRAVSTAIGEKTELCIDLLREYAEGEVAELLRARRGRAPAELTAGDILTGALQNRLGRMVVKYAGVDGNRPIRELTDRDISAVARAAKSFMLPVRGTEGFAAAQVTAGGIRTEEYDPRTMQSRIVPNLYACGEVLDVDGDCGGFNLQWAWASGRLAGKLL